MQPTTITIEEPQQKRHTLRWIIIGLLAVGIIAAVVFFIIQQAQRVNLENSVKTELIRQNKIIKSSAMNNLYKQTLPSTIASTGIVKIDAKVSVTGTSYCISATSNVDSKVAFYMNEKTPEDGPISGNCTSGKTSTLPSVPGSVAVSSSGVNDITLSWMASLYATGYTVQCAKNQSFTIGLSSQSTINQSFRIDNLVANTSYYCRVAATNPNGQSTWSSTLQAQTNLYSQPPLKMTATIVSSTELSYSWDAVPGAEYYVLQYTTDINFMNNVTELRVITTSGLIKGLQPYTGYFMRAQAVTANFDQTRAAFSNPAFARTKKAE
ncbi:MAG: hypothetical protein EOT05_00080 [Candidatus Microsaccharimonas sossegonensis]|uniref:Fibronectin type-III domain-containing protein n=1 Tax=Candidatus Microsaccharimonas sossegonensis TaxID=2506948 RepID=A0A4Q0AGA1_9BACT|nr:MAG: hypothetical protein EOT05_00080 [Candidatus Microsaccharimonas sossegonensis]